MPPWEKENRLQICLGWGYVSSQECKLNILDLERWQCEVQDYFRNVMDLIFKAYHLYIVTFICGAVAGKSTFRDFLSVKMTILGIK